MPASLTGTPQPTVSADD